MKQHRFNLNLLALSLLLTANGTSMADDTVLFRGVPDLEGPVVQHTPGKDPAPSGSPVTISATVTDNIGVKYVLVNYRSAGSKEYLQAPMQQLGNSLYSATIPAVHVQNVALEYYIEAVDLSGNTVLRGLDFQPMIISVTPPVPVNVAAEPILQTKPGASTQIVTRSEKNNNWIWWTVGAVVAGSAAYAFTRGSDSGSNEPTTGSIVITSPQPK